MNGEAAQATGPTAAQLRAATAEPVRPEPIDLTQRREAKQAAAQPAGAELAQEKGTPAPRKAEGKPPETLKQYQFIESGSIDIPVKPDQQTLHSIAERILKRQQTARELEGKEKALTVIDRWLINLDGEALNRLEAGNPNREDLVFSWYLVHDELLQKSLAVSQYVREHPEQQGTFGRVIRAIPLIGRLARAPGIETQLERSAPRLSSQYTKEIGFDTWDERRVLSSLTNLNQLRLNIERSLFGQGFQDPLFDQVSTSVFPSAFVDKTGNRLHDEVIDQLHGEEGILKQQYGGRTFLELWQEDPAVAMQALFEANQRALTQFAEESAETLLMKERPTADTNAIEAHAKKLEEKPKAEDITKLQEAVTKATTEFEDAERKYKSLKTPVDQAKAAEKQSRQEFDRASKKLEELSASLTKDIARREKNLEALYNSTIREPDASLTPEQRASFQQSFAAATQNIARLEEALTAQQSKMEQLITQKAEAELDSKNKETETKEVEAKANSEGLEQAGEDFKSKKSAKETAETNLKTAQDGIVKEVSPENTEKAKALRTWIETGAGFEQIMEVRYSQRHGDEFTRERLASIQNRPDGQIDGTERIREHIFRTINPQAYDPVLARKMVSDEVIAKAIIWIYKLDTNSIYSTQGDSLAQVLESLENVTYAEQSFTRQTTVNDELRFRSLNLLRARRNELAQELARTTLPYLRGSQFKVADVLRFIAQDGLKTAQNGNPYLEISNYYINTQPELQVEAESIYRAGVGHTAIHDHELIWDGEVVNAVDSYLPTANPMHYRVRQHFDRGAVNYSIDVQTNLRFLQALPPAATVDLPPQIRERFYDGAGNLRTELRGLEGVALERLVRRGGVGPFLNIPEWITLRDNMHVTDLQANETAGERKATDAVLTHLRRDISEEMPRLVAASAADFVLQQSNQERVGLLRGFAVVVVPNVALSENLNITRDYLVDLDNEGNLFITIESDPRRPRQELNQFYRRRLEEYRRTRGVQMLSVQERTLLRNEFLAIQEAVGREVIRAQQAR